MRAAYVRSTGIGVRWRRSPVLTSRRVLSTEEIEHELTWYLELRAWYGILVVKSRLVLVPGCGEEAWGLFQDVITRY
eukprot:2685404-Rhodomonas_salina.4